MKQIHRCESYYGNWWQRHFRYKYEYLGIQPGDSFNPHVSSNIRLAGKKRLYKIMGQGQRYIAKMLGVKSKDEMEPLGKPQLSPIFSNFHYNFSAYAAVGNTVYLEYNERMRNDVLLTYMKDYLDKADTIDLVLVDGAIYKRIAGVIAKAIQIRLALEQIKKEKVGNFIEAYHFFTAALQNLYFITIDDLIIAAICYGDLLPPINKLNLHEMSQDILEDILKISAPYFELLEDPDTDNYLDLGMSWTQKLIRTIGPKYLPYRKSDIEDLADDAAYRRKKHYRNRYSHPDDIMEMMSEKIPPLNQSNLPLLNSAENIMENLKKILNEKNTGSNETQNEATKKFFQDITSCFNTIFTASKPPSQYQGIRSDLSEIDIGAKVFEKCSIEGNPVEGVEVAAEFNGEFVTGEIFDETLGMSENDVEYQLLMQEADPLIGKLRQIIYPSVIELPEIQKIRTSGLLDQNRIYAAAFSDAIYKRYIIQKKPDKKGSPVVALCADGSGSMTNAKIRMNKILLTALLMSIPGNVKLLAGLYNSGPVGGGLNGDRIRWIFHPHKSLAETNQDAVKILISLPDTGEGGQLDSLGLTYFMSEARKLAKSKMIYLLHFTDIKFNMSFNKHASATEEVYETYRSFINEGNVHITQIAYTSEQQTGFEGLVDQVIIIPDCSDYEGVAFKIGEYVGNLIKERKKFLKSLK